MISTVCFWTGNYNCKWVYSSHNYISSRYPDCTS